MLVLLKKPDLAAHMRANLHDDRLFSRLTEEILRTEAPVQGLPRMTTEDTVLGGCPIPKGSLILLGYASGNRDDERFEEPDEFVLTRKNAGQHLSFGAGIHRCVGAMLSRMEIKVSMRMLLTRIADMALAVPAEELRYTPSMVVRPLVSLPMTFTMQR
jgi:cytochrome P450